MRMSARNLLIVAVATVAACSGDTIRTSRSDGRPSDAPGAAGGASSPQGSPIAPRGAYVGNRYEALPRGVTYVSGAVLPTGRGGGGEFELARVRTERGEMVWFDSLSRSSRPTPTRFVRAELRIPPLGRDEQLQLGSCDVSGKLDPRVVAIVVSEPNATKFTQVRQAWRVNVVRGQFELIPVSGITCEEPGGG